MGVGLDPGTLAFHSHVLTTAAPFLLWVYCWISFQILLFGIWDRNIMYLMSFNVLMDESAYSLRYKLIKITARNVSYKTYKDGALSNLV